MLHTKFHENRPAGSGEDFWVVFTIYGPGGHLGHLIGQAVSEKKIFEKCVWMQAGQGQEMTLN